jgi:hypothetical protein
MDRYQGAVAHRRLKEKMGEVGEAEIEQVHAAYFKLHKIK